MTNLRKKLVEGVEQNCNGAGTGREILVFTPKTFYPNFCPDSLMQTVELEKFIGEELNDSGARLVGGIAYFWNPSSGKTVFVVYEKAGGKR